MSTANIYPALREGLKLYAEHPFEAHERFEDGWRDATGEAKDLLQALVQICAARVKASQGNLRGTDKLLEKASERLANIGAPSLLSLDVIGLRAKVMSARRRRAAGESWQVDLPDDAAPAGVLYLHGFASSPGSAKAQKIVPALRARGLCVRVPDLNADDFEHLTVGRALEQARGLLFDRTLVIGSSLGGYIASLLQRQDPRVVAMVLMAPAYDFAARLEGRHGAEALEAWRRTGVTLVEHYGYGGMRRIGYGLYEDALTHDPRPFPTVPTYVLQGARDDVVPAEVVQAVLRAAGPEVTLEIVDDEHGLVDSSRLALEAAERLEAHLAAPAGDDGSV